MIYIHVFFLFSFILCQSLDTSINLTNFMYPEIDDIHVILDEGGENTYFINTHYPLYLNDFSKNQILIDGSLQLPQGSFVFPKLLPLTMAPDSIQNISQIHYQKGDFNSDRKSSYYPLKSVGEVPNRLFYQSWDTCGSFLALPELIRSLSASHEPNRFEKVSQNAENRRF